MVWFLIQYHSCDRRVQSHLSVDVVGVSEIVTAEQADSWECGLTIA